MVEIDIDGYKRRNLFYVYAGGAAVINHTDEPPAKKNDRITSGGSVLCIDDELLQFTAALVPTRSDARDIRMWVLSLSGFRFRFTQNRSGVIGSVVYSVPTFGFQEAYTAPSGYHLFRSMAHALSEQRFTSYEDTKNWVDSWIASKYKEFFRLGIRMLPERWKKVFASFEQYFDKN
ncbi:Mariner Mos1 transposase [Eumeta japonica]|uniref:Mariner Mos1 transposase n=1 Tax=Eumeta variegata TaxID=151549 RepID=A0A4C2A787_EUMVA|nr:Mariner Mos1 transposase [Eumeta japonica]